jgi:anti-sigma factor RsiW
MEKHCRDFADQLSAYIDGELKGPDQEEIALHLATCNICRHCLGELKLTRDMLQKMDHPTLPVNLKARLKSCLKQFES